MADIKYKMVSADPREYYFLSRDVAGAGSLAGMGLLREIILREDESLVVPALPLELQTASKDAIRAYHRACAGLAGAYITPELFSSGRVELRADDPSVIEAFKFLMTSPPSRSEEEEEEERSSYRFS